MRRLFELLTVFDWVTPAVELAQDIAENPTTFRMDRKNFDKAKTVLQGVGYRGGHMGGGSSAYGIIVKDEDAADVMMQLSAAGVTWK